MQRQEAIDEIMAQEICDGHRELWEGFTGLDIPSDQPTDYSHLERYGEIISLNGDTYKG